VALGPILLLAAFIACLAVVLFPAVWFADQLSIIGGRAFSRWTWVIAQAGFAAAALFPSLLGVAAVKTPRMRAVFQTWALAGLFAIILLPVQLAPAAAQQTAALLQIASATLYLAVLWLLRRRGNVPPSSGAGPVWLAIVAAALIGWPWVLWGALGSWLDTLLNLVAALLFGVAAGKTLHTYLWRHIRSGDGEAALPYFISGLATGIALMVMGASFGHNGQQLVLLFLLSGLGWLVVAITPKNQGGELSPASLPGSLLIGLAVAGPLLFLDPEELSLMLNLGSRDVGVYAIYATLLSLGIALLLGVIGWLPGQRDGRGRVLPAFLTTAVLAALAGIYLLAGQPGWHGERLYVMMVDQADLSAAATIADPIERRVFTYEHLTGHADQSQAEIRQALERVGIDYQPYYLVNALEVDAGPLLRLWLESRPEVDRVLLSPELRPLPEQPPLTRGSVAPPNGPQWNLSVIGAPPVWDEFGARGAGVVIGQSDSGVEGTHPELHEQYRGAQPDGPMGDDYNWYDPWNASPSPTDIGGHGTHTLGSVLGRTVGVAPDASWIGCVNLARNLGNAPRYLDCLQFLLAPFPQSGDPFDGRPELGANVLNNSWGCPAIEGCDPTSLLPAARALRAAGVFVVASAGNDGSACGTIYAPIALYDEVFTVGAVDELGEVAPFSSRGPVLADGSGRVKPDIVAPGVGVLSAYPGGTYAYNDGTSMAGPHVAGVVALLWSADPTLIGDIDRTEQLMTASAQPLDNMPEAAQCGATGELPNNVSGFGLIDAYAAVQMALSENQ
jgi:hypothetical protein